MNDDARRQLDDLSRQIQVQRNIEMHAAMERARLETQRVELMSQMLTQAVAPVGALAAPPAAPYRVVMQSTPFAPAPARAVAATPPAGAKRRPKPEGLPSVANMIKTVLHDAPGGLRPCEVTAAIRRRWWPDVSGAIVSSTVWHMAEKGRLTKTGSTYRLPPTAPTNGHGPQETVRERS